MHLSLRGLHVSGLIAVVALTATACSGTDTTSSAAGAKPTPTPTAPVTYDTTGLPAPDGWQRTPVVVVKVDNVPQAYPQHGVEAADLVVEEPVEGGLTRFAAFYQSQYPTVVVPVRSVRKSDIGLVQPVRPLVLTSGGYGRTLELLHAAHVNVVPDDGENPIYSRDPERSLPHDLIVNTQMAVKRQHAQLPTQAYLDFGADLPAAGRAVRRVDVTFSPWAAETWTYNRTTRLWVRKVAGNTTYRVPSLVLLTVKERDAGYVDAAGSRVPEVISTGTGKGHLLTADGTVRAIRWTKSSTTDPWQFATTDGAPVQVPVGRSWISLLPKQWADVNLH